MALIRTNDCDARNRYPMIFSLGVAHEQPHKTCCGAVALACQFRVVARPLVGDDEACETKNLSLVVR
jgi:hypothetical protein